MNEIFAYSISLYYGNETFTVRDFEKLIKKLKVYNPIDFKNSSSLIRAHTDDGDKIVKAKSLYKEIELTQGQIEEIELKIDEKIASSEAWLKTLKSPVTGNCFYTKGDREKLIKNEKDMTKLVWNENAKESDLKFE